MGNNWSRFTDVLSGAVPGLGETVVIVFVIVVLLWLTLLVRAWFRDDAGHTGQSGDLLSEMRDLHREGGLTDDEYRLIKSRLVSAATGGSGSSRRPPSPPAAKTADASTEPPATTEPTAPSLNGRSDSPGQEAAGLPDGQS